MTTFTLNIVSLCVVLAGCGGDSFGGAAASDGGVGEADGARVTADAVGAGGGTQAREGGAGGPGAGGHAGTGTGGEAADGGTVTPGAGGATTEGGFGTGGAAPGAGGTVPGAGGMTAEDGPGAGGAAPGAGGASQGAGGAAPEAGPGCKPPVVDETNLPPTVVWESYLTKYGTYCLTCQHSPCTICPLTWWPVTQSADGLTVTATINKGVCDPLPLNMGLCTSDLTAGSCTTLNPSVEATFVLRLEPKPDGTGYRVADASGEQARVTRLYGSCTGGTIQGATTFDNAWAAYPADRSLLAATRATMLAAEWPCGR